MTLATPLTAADDAVLRHCLETGPLGERARGPVAAVRWRRFELATSYDTRIASVQLATGGELEVFLKDFGFSVRPKDSAKARREREVRVYRELLADAGLGTPVCYGAVLDESGGRFWLLLELVRGDPVGYRPLESWAPAAAALGRLHGYFSSRGARLTRRDFLVQHSTRFFQGSAEKAVRNVAQIAPHQRERVERLVSRYAPIIELMAALPTTLVHGGCRPSNILIDVAPPDDPRRVSIVDWEEAGIGSPFFDLAYLLDGVQPPVLDRLLDAHREAAGIHGLTFPPPDEVKYLIECFRLHIIMNYLGRAVLHGYDESAVAKLLGIGEQIGDAVFERRG